MFDCVLVDNTPVGSNVPGKRGEIFIATKFGFVRKPDPTKGPTIDGSTEYVKEALDGCLSRLGVDQIDLWYLHR